MCVYVWGFVCVCVCVCMCVCECVCGLLTQWLTNYINDINQMLLTPWRTPTQRDNSLALALASRWPETILASPSPFSWGTPGFPCHSTCFSARDRQTSPVLGESPDLSLLFPWLGYVIVCKVWMWIQYPHPNITSLVNIWWLVTSHKSTHAVRWGLLSAG